jgi:ABC-type uncharacterized transport system fused permease/ATPase subunit
MKVVALTPSFWWSLKTIACASFDRHTALLVSFELVLTLTFGWAYRFVASASGMWTIGIQENNSAVMEKALFNMIFAMIVGGVVNGAVIYVGDLLLLTVWNAKLSKFVLDLYMKPMAFYRVQSELPDPEARIATDIPNFCLKLRILLFGTPLLISMPPGLLAVLTSSLWSSIEIAQVGGWFTVAVTVGFFGMFVILNRIFVPIAARAMKADSSRYSSYRFSHVHLRLHSEHVAFLRGEDAELSKMTKQLAEIVAQSQSIALRTAPINTSGNFFFIWCVALAFTAPGFSWLYVGSEKYTVDEFYTVSTLVVNLCYSLTAILLLATEFSEFSSATKRVGEIIFALQRTNRSLEAEKTSRFSFVYDNDVVSYNNITFASPGEKLVLRGINLSVPRGGANNLLIMGPSGVGKSSMLRVLGGLWPVVDGSITKPRAIGRDGITFMPQKPYLTLGTFKEQITYPDPGSAITDEEAAELLRLVRMEYILDRAPDQVKIAANLDDVDDVDAVVEPPYSPAESLGQQLLPSTTTFERSAEPNTALSVKSPDRYPVLCQREVWSDTLSGGEQQRLGIARILYQRPAFAVLDECTSALDEDIEHAVYEQLTKKGISLISIAHRSTVKKWHHRLFLIERDGTYTVTELSCPS